MKTIHILTTGTLLSALALLAPGASAQSTPPAAPPPHAPAATPAPDAAPAPAPQPAMAGYDKVIYVQRLPSVDEIVAAAPSGAVAERIELLSTQVSVYYRYSNGALSSVVYAQLAPTGSASTSPVPPAAPPASVSGPSTASAAPAPGAAVPTSPPPAGYYYYPTYSYPVDPYYYDYATPYPYGYPYLYPFGGIRLGIGIGIGREHGRR